MAAGENSSKKSFALRVDAELFAALNAWAEAELRSVNGQIEGVLREALRGEGRLPKKYRQLGEEKQERRYKNVLNAEAKIWGAGSSAAMPA